MIVNILHDFLLFEFSDVERVMKLLTDISWKFLACLLIAELLIARFRENSNIQDSGFDTQANRTPTHIRVLK